MASPVPAILRFEDIEEALNEGKLLTNWTRSSIQAASYDLRVGTIFKDGKIVNEEHEERQRPFLIQPGEIISIFTLEEVILPPNIAGVTFAINKWSSEGLLVLNPGHVDPGYRGPLTVKALNLRKTPISISREEPIFTIIFHNIGSHTSHPYPGAVLSRHEKERSFHAREQEIAPTSLGDLLKVMANLPFVTNEQMDRAIREHWISRWTFGLLIVAAIGAILAVIVGLFN
jgi:deoxycytidine triphosphate deaminase